MRRTFRLSAISLSLSAAVILAGCDASPGTQLDTTADQEPDPVVVDYPIAYISRPLPRDEDGAIIPDTLLDPGAFKPGAKLILKDRASVTAAEVVLTDDLFVEDEEGEPPLYDVKDLSVSHDGMKLLFALRAPEIEGADEDEQPTWNIWEYDRETASMRRIIVSDLVAEQGDDIAPRYLPDGSIVFSSTRQPRAKAILLDENKPQYNPGTEDDRDEATFVLHRMDEDGADIQQLTYNQSHDLSPFILDDGRIGFLRWNNYVGGGQDAVSLYTVNPDGSKVSPHYGYHSQETGTNDTEAVFAKPFQMPEGPILVTLKSRESETQGGDIVLIDAQQFVDYEQPVEGVSEAGPAQTSTTDGLAHTDDSVSPKGYFSSAYPLFDGTNRLLASWSACLVQGIKLGVYVSVDGFLVNNLGQMVDEDGNLLGSGATPVIPDASDIGTYPCGSHILALDEIATPPPMYGLWTFDLSDNTQRPVVLATEDTLFTEAVVLESRPVPAYIPPETPDETQQALIEANLGVVHIRSVYDFHGTDNTIDGIDAMADPLITPTDNRPVRFLRILKAVSLPDEDTYDFDNSAFGRAGGQMKDILGYVPVEPDGSVKFSVPADVAFTFSLLDAQGRRVPGYLGDRHRNWLTVRPGETRECLGCHAQNNTLAHGRLEAETPSAWAGALGGNPFPNTRLLDEFDVVQPPPESGETMAEYYARLNGARTPSVDLLYQDDWTDPAIATPGTAIDLSYADLPSTAAPVSAACQSEWTPLCRVVINYTAHIQPIWEVSRQTFDEADPTLLLEDRTCVSCHSAVDAMDQAQVPAAQLELTGEQSADRNDYVNSYAELFFNDVPQEVIDGVLVDQTEQATDDDGNLLFVTDDEGELVLDDDGNPIPILVTVAPRPAYLSPAGARNNARFFQIFAAGGTHEGDLEAAELKLLAEWLDIGGQYYNNPFDAPED